MEHATLTEIDEREKRPRARLTRYEDDAWAMEQADLLEAGRFADLDRVNLADEVADVGRREYDGSESDLARVIQHLLKRHVQPSPRSRSGVDTIKERRRRVNRRLDDDPSSKGRRAEGLQEVFKRGRAEALIETHLPDGDIPESNTRSSDQVTSRPVDWPEP